MIRIYQKELVTVSSDSGPVPKQILFQSDSTVEDLISLTEVKNSSDIFPVGTTVVSLGNIAAGKFLYIKPTGDCTVVLDSGSINVLAGKETKIWADFTSLSITQATIPNDITLLIGG